MLKFSKLWEDCIHEEARITVRDEKLGSSEDQALFVRAKKERGRSNHSPRRFQKGPKKDYSTFKCYKCQVLGHIARNCPQQDPKKKSKTKKFHAHVAEEEVPSKRTKEEPSEEEYVLISALSGSVSP